MLTAACKKKKIIFCLNKQKREKIYIQNEKRKQIKKSWDFRKSKYLFLIFI
jgi:hypothetical protein